MSVEEQIFELEEYLLSEYGTELNIETLRDDDDFILKDIVDVDGNELITLHSNRFSSAKIIEPKDSDIFHDKWKNNIEKYDQWLLEKINFKLKELKIIRICIAWNTHCLFNNKNFGNQPRIYNFINSNWIKDDY